MKISRRNFLGAVSASIAVGIPIAAGSNRSGLISSLVDKSGGALGNDALSLLGWNSFYPYLNTTFEFSTGKRGRISEVSQLTLSAMTSDRPFDGKSGRAEPSCFLLTFRARADADGPRLTQNTYAVNHFSLGRFDLFISDADFADGDYIYNAVINRVTE